LRSAEDEMAFQKAEQQCMRTELKMTSPRSLDDQETVLRALEAVDEKKNRGVSSAIGES
jgi:hypothetical protein